MDGDEEDVLGAEAVTPCVYAADALAETDVSILGDGTLGVVALGAEPPDHLADDLAAVDVFLQAPVGGLFASGQRRVAVARFK